MSRDIRSYFLPKGALNSSKPESKQVSKSKDIGKKSHKRICVIDSDSEEEKTPSKRGKDIYKESKDSKPIKVDKSSPKLKPVNVAAAFGTDKVKRTSEKIVTKVKEKAQVNSKISDLEEVHSDPDFEATLRQVEELESAYFENQGKKEASSKPIEENDSETFKTEKLSPSESKQEKTSIKDVKDRLHHKDRSPKLSPSPKNAKEKKSLKSNELSTLSPKKEEKKRKREPSVDPTKEEKKHRDESHSSKRVNGCVHALSEASVKIKDEEEDESSKGITPKKALDHSFQSPSLDPVEKKREHALNYLKYLQREGPKNLGSKELPKGKPGCFSGLTFVITGVLDSLERDQAANLIKEYGGRVTGSVSKKTSYLVRGDEPGASKLDKAISFGTPQVDEDGLLKLIVDRSADMPEEAKKDVAVKKGLADSRVSSNSESKKRSTQAESEEVRSSKSGSKRARLQTPDEEVRPVKVAGKKGHSQSPDEKVRPLKVAGKKGHSQSPDEDVRPLKSEDKKAEPPLWVEKYRPTSSKQIIGQQGDRSAMRKLTSWLQNWHKNHSGNKKLARPSPWAKNDDGAYFKAALLSGPPGVGKTTMAHVVSKELGFDIVEFNASDTRSKSRLHSEVATLLSSQSLFGYFHAGGSNKTSAKHVLIMDEVDGMAGNEDRGGVQELIQLIKNSHVPIICTCNDRNHPKIRSLVNYCFDLRIPKPRVEQIRGSMMSICFKEGLKIGADAMTDLINGANQDIRQILNHMAMWTAKNKHLSTEEAKVESQKAKKDLKIGPWDVLKKVFSAEDHRSMSIMDKSDLFFYDYSLSPLFVQENYLSVVPVRAEGKVPKTLELVAKAAESISLGDVVDRSIRSNNAWSLLPVQAMYASVLPGDYMEGYLRSQINFPSWLGKNSRRNKLDRMLQELQVHMRLTTSASKEAVNLDYLSSIRDAVFRPLVREGAAGIPASLGVMRDYHLLREDLESLVELTTWPGDKDPMSLVDSKVKAAMTRAYNKEGFLTPYSVVAAPKKRAAGSSQELDLDEDEQEDDREEEEDDDVTHDAMIKAKKRTAPKTSHKEPDTSAGGSGSSKGKGKGKGKGRKKAE